MEHKFCARTCTELRNSHFFVRLLPIGKTEAEMRWFVTMPVFYCGDNYGFTFWREQLHSESSDDLSKCCHYCWDSAITYWFWRCYFAGKHRSTYQLVGPILASGDTFCIMTPSELSKRDDAWWASHRKFSLGQQQLLYHSDMGTVGDVLCSSLQSFMAMWCSLRI